MQTSRRTVTVIGVITLTVGKQQEAPPVRQSLLFLHPKDLSSSDLARSPTSEMQGLLTYIIAFQLKHFELQRDPVLGWSYHLPDAVFVSRIFLGPSRASNGPIELGDEAPTGSWRGNK